MGPLLPMNIFLRQEIDRIQKVICEVQRTLNDLRLAIDGTIIMSQSLREALDAMYDARIPDRWKKVSMSIIHYLLCYIIFGFSVSLAIIERYIFHTIIKSEY